jgi:surface antigen
MKTLWLTLTAGLLLAALAPAQARSNFELGAASGGSSGELAPYQQCAPYAREVTGIQIYGEAYSWWDQAEGRYQRGHRPRPGSVMAFRPHGAMRLGHVAAVSRVLDSRTVLLRHANWSPVGGKRGQVERDVKAVDVSPANDWSEVRVWYAPLQGLGATRWPVEGFIYSERPAPVRGPARRAPPPSHMRSSDPIGDIIAGRYR